VTFDRPVDVSTFTTDDVISFTDPNSNAIPVARVSVVPGSDDREFDVAFGTQAEYGSYTMGIGPDIKDLDGNPMIQTYTASFSIVSPVIGTDAFGYTAQVAAFEHLNLDPSDPKVFTVIDSGYDVAQAIDLGGNTFTFYGVTYSGAGSLWVTSNGLIT